MIDPITGRQRPRRFHQSHRVSQPRGVASVRACGLLGSPFSSPLTQENKIQETEVSSGESDESHRPLLSSK